MSQLLYQFPDLTIDISWSLGSCQGNEDGEYQHWREDIEGLQSGEEIVIIENFEGIIGENHRFFIHVDAGKDIRETNEENNEMTIEFVL